MRQAAGDEGRGEDEAAAIIPGAGGRAEIRQVFVHGGRRDGRSCRWWPCSTCASRSSRKGDLLGDIRPSRALVGLAAVRHRGRDRGNQSRSAGARAARRTTSLSLLRVATHDAGKDVEAEPERGLGHLPAPVKQCILRRPRRSPRASGAGCPRRCGCGRPAALPVARAARMCTESAHAARGCASFVPVVVQPGLADRHHAPGGPPSATGRATSGSSQSALSGCTPTEATGGRGARRAHAHANSSSRTPMHSAVPTPLAAMVARISSSARRGQENRDDSESTNIRVLEWLMGVGVVELGSARRAGPCLPAPLRACAWNQLEPRWPASTFSMRSRSTSWTRRARTARRCPGSCRPARRPAIHTTVPATGWRSRSSMSCSSMRPRRPACSSLGVGTKIRRWPGRACRPRRAPTLS